MNFSFQPQVGAAPLLFGMSRDQARDALKKLTEYSNPSEPTSEKYTEGVILDFDRNDKLSYIEVSEPSSAILGDIEFFVDDLEEVLQRLRELDSNVYDKVGSYFAPGIGVALYAPQGQILSASLHVSGYYDNRVPYR